MDDPKSWGSRIRGVLFALFIELPVAIWEGTQKPLWQEPPLVIALWVGGFALFFFVIFKIASRASPLDDFRAAGRKMKFRNYPKPQKGDPR